MKLDPNAVPPVRHDWLAHTTEEILDPDLAIVDAHHHFWDRPAGRYHRYMLDDILDDIGMGHNVRATVYMQCGAMYRATGPVALHPVGETEFVNGVAAMSASGHYGACQVAAGIVGHANLLLGTDVQGVLQAHIQCGGGRFRGVRHISTWHDHPELVNTRNPAPKDLFHQEVFRNGFAQLAPLGLSFDAWLYQSQIDDLTQLARAFPQTPIVLNHCGGPLRSGPYRSRLDEGFLEWKKSLQVLAACKNVVVKVGGLAMHRIGFDLFDRTKPVGSLELAHLWRPYIETCIELFGSDRCMFESNFPVDKVSCSYTVLWNAFKRLTQGMSTHQRNDLFHETATRVYRL